MNFIETIEIKNFKSIRHQKIEGCKRINVFIGYPNVGKSNLIEALSLYSVDRHNFNFESIVRIEGLTSLFFNGEISRKSEVIINNHYRYSAQYRNDRIAFECEVDRDNQSFEALDKSHSYHSWNIVEFEKVFNSSIIHNFKATSADLENKLPVIKKYDCPKKIESADSNSPSLVHPSGNNIFEVISRNEQLRNEVSEPFKEYNLNLLYDKSTQGFKILKFVGNDIFLIPYSMIAETLQRLIFFKAAILSNRESVLLIEEPEAHMFPPYISKFTTDVIQNNNKNQFFINTQSPFVLNDFMEELDKGELAIFAVGYKKDSGETIVKKIADEELDEIYQYGVDLFFNLEDYLRDVVP